jgi:hypothetical protein
MCRHIGLGAFGLAELLCIGAVKREVYRKRGESAALGHRAKAHTLSTRTALGR